MLTGELIDSCRMSSLFCRLITLATCSWLPNRLHDFPALIDLVYKSYSMALRTLEAIKCNSIGIYDFGIVQREIELVCYY